MADEQYRWLNRGEAERLLNGEPPETADPVARDQARRLAGTLGALSSPPPSDGGELPGEAAALAAFRTAREEREGRTGTAGGADHPGGTAPSGIGPVRIGAPRGDRSGTAGGTRRGRSAYLGLAAAMVVGVAGGAAVLAGTGLPATPSAPAASVTATGTRPGHPLVSPPPEDGAPDGAAPGGRRSGSTAGTAEDGAGDADGSRAPGEPGADTGDGAVRSGRGWKQTAAACRAWRDGEALNGARARLLEDAAGSPSRVGPYCEGVLSPSGASGASGASGGASGAGGGAHRGDGNGKADGGNKGQGQGQGNGTGRGEGDGANKGEGDGADNGKGNGADNGKGRAGSHGKGGGKNR